MSVPVIGMLVQGAIDLFNRVVPDKQAQAKFEADLKLMQFQAQTENLNAQIKVNEKQAEHPDTFVAGPRPAAMWLCIIAMGIGVLSKVVIPTLLAFLVFIPDFNTTKLYECLELLNSIDIEFYVIMLANLLGLAAMRSYDKLHGTDTKTMVRRGK